MSGDQNYWNDPPPLTATLVQTPTVLGMGIRHDDGKVRLDLIPPEWIWGLGQVLTSGAAKYAERNWELGMKWGRVIGSLMRHVMKFMAGERYDPETGNHHMAMAAWNCLTLMSYDLRKIGEDDRAKLDPEILKETKSG